MNKKYFISFALTIIAGILFTACESHEEKADSAFELYRNEKKAAVVIENTITSNNPLKDSLIIAAVIKPSSKIIQARAFEKQDEWTLFKIECETKIIENEKQIKEITNQNSTNPKMLKKAVSIEKENNDIRKEIAEYQEEVKLSLANFKSKINNATFEIKSRLNELVITKK